MLQTRDSQVVSRFTSEEIDEEIFESFHFVSLLPSLSRKDQDRFHHDSDFRNFKLFEGLIVVDTEFELIRHHPVERSTKHDVLRAFFVMTAEGEERSVFLRHKLLEVGSVFERFDLVLLLIENGLGFLECVQILEDLGRSLIDVCSFDERRFFRVLDR